MTVDTNWYLVRTKVGKERVVHDRLERLVPLVFLPLLKTRVRRSGRLTWSIVPLFPCYILARFTLHEHYYNVRYSPGVHSIVSAGRDPIAVPDDLVIAIQQRGNDGIVELPEASFVAGEGVRIIDGPFSGFQGIFDRYLSGTERVAILLRTVESAGVRIVLPTDAVIHEHKYRS